MKCDRHLGQISDDEIIEIESKMKVTREHDHKIIPFLLKHQHLRYVIRRDHFTLAQRGFQIEDIKSPLHRVLKTFQRKSRDYRKTHDLGDSFVSEEVQFHNDSSIKFKNMVTKVMNRSTPRQPGVQVITGNSSILPKWSGEDPFKKLPEYNSEWSEKTRMQMKISDPETYKEYVVAEIEWNGSHRCPFQHADDKAYHGYEYGCRDYIVTNAAGEHLAISELSQHMIDRHDFFGGDNAYRLDPLKLVDFFGIDVKISQVSDESILLPLEPFIEPSIEECLEQLFAVKISDPDDTSEQPVECVRYLFSSEED